MMKTRLSWQSRVEGVLLKKQDQKEHSWPSSFIPHCLIDIVMTLKGTQAKRSAKNLSEFRSGYSEEANLDPVRVHPYQR